MELKQIRYFVEVARRGSINKAAHALSIAQPALTRHIHALEEELGAQLLIRTRQGVRVTEVGETMLRHGQEVLEEILQLHEAIVQAKSSLTGTIRLGFVPTIAFTLTPILLEESNLRYPNVRLHIVEAARSTVRDWLVDDVIDVAFMQEIEGSTELRQRFVAEEDMVLVGTPKLLCSVGASMTWEEVSRMPLILTPGIHDFVAQWAEEQSVALNVPHKVNSIHAIMETLKSGKFCSIVPFSVAWQRAEAGELMTVLLSDPPITRRLVTAYSASRPVSPSMVAVHTLLTDAVGRVRMNARAPQGKARSARQGPL